MVEEFKADKDKSEWSKAMGNKLVEWYNELITQGKGSNKARTMTIAARAFLVLKPIGFGSNEAK
jgi:hypothetical protein